MSNLATLSPAWTPETAPRNGGRPKGSRDRISTRITEAIAAFLTGDETHPAFDFTGWLGRLATSGAQADNATLARILMQYVPQDVRLEVGASLAELIERSRAVPRERIEELRRAEVIDVDARVVEAEDAGREPTSGNAEAPAGAERDAVDS